MKGKRKLEQLREASNRYTSEDYPPVDSLPAPLQRFLKPNQGFPKENWKGSAAHSMSSQRFLTKFGIKWE